ncbi:B-cell receptor-associated protein 31-like-domain-containing protein [Polychytrium aggregatum]|uniref:B-cell receptor-associated protein 31-like-domain-containing protein n=1 Tax=Polychytrium aggregatum TaxID=110093 RepID=UPI0022FED3EC|nr:B-cell receptor-associated protein 31-like-domain-containing protein [Polychytrium aggregatum]KAI9204196.1 B-cell receptor-associated protein 31-like-domain-containing protein [Polychytrium aggregatum]
MSLFNHLIYYALISEIVIFILLLVPLNFVPLKTRKYIFETVSQIVQHEYIVWAGRLFLVIVGGVFVDTINRLYRLEHDHAHNHDHSAHEHNALAREAYYDEKIKKLYNQRNMYMSLFSLFMVLVLYRRLKDIYEHILNQQRIRALTDAAKAAESTQGSSATTSSNLKDIPLTERVESSTAAESSGLRKRTAS